MARKANRGPRKGVSGWVAADLAVWVSTQAAEEGVTKSDIVERALMGERAKAERAAKRAKTAQA